MDAVVFGTGTGGTLAGEFECHQILWWIESFSTLNDTINIVNGDSDYNI